MPIVIEADQMVIGDGSPPVLHAAVVIADGRIAYAGAAAGAPREPSTQVIQARGGTVLPGLIDVHVHITNDGGPGKTAAVLGDAFDAAADLAMRGYANALVSLRAGYTTLRNLHAPLFADIAVRDTINTGRLVGPRLVVCGQGLCITGGHMDRGTLADHVTVSGRIGVCDTPDEFRRAVRQMVKRNVDFIKINSDVGSMLDPAAPYVPEMTFPEMEAVCTEAHRLGLHVAAHTAGGPPIEEALTAGVDTIEHGHWLTDRAIELMLDRDASYVPTLIVNSRNFTYDGETLGVSERSWRWLRAAYDAKWDSLERAHRAGVTIAAGSDAGFLVNHGENACELEELVKGGFTPNEAIRAATGSAAKLLGLSEKIGTLEPGKLADVIVVAGDPLADITVLQRQECITHVFKDGRIVQASPLQETRR
jgi:imidazolonepropionase-like amidohydrolase